MYSLTSTYFTIIAQPVIPADALQRGDVKHTMIGTITITQRRIDVINRAVGATEAGIADAHACVTDAVTGAV